MLAKKKSQQIKSGAPSTFTEAQKDHHKSLVTLALNWLWLNDVA